MHDASDIELLRDYNRQRSEAAFAELVERHINLVYTAALRHVGIAAHAEEITQAVFVILARKAASLRPEAVLDAWLYETTRLTSLSFLRGERRRQFREHEAYMQSTYPESADASVWLQLAPLLDEAMARLNKKDREAVVMRFFKQKNLGEVAAAMTISEAAAQSRVHRAVEKLREFFLKHGVDSTASAIAGQISANSIQAAPAGLAKTISAVAIAKGATASGSTLTLIKGALKIMAWTKAKTAVVVGAAVILGTGTSILVVKKISSPSSSATPPTAQAETASSSPVAQPALTAWQQGDKAAAVSSYLAADWSARPLFAADSPLSLSESQFAALSDADRQAKSSVLTAQLDSFKQLAAAVRQAGSDAASKGDVAQARKCFTALKQCGTALASPDCLSLVQLVGQSLIKRADTELARIGQ